MKDPFKVGDVVRVYGTVPCEMNDRGRAYKRGDRAKVISVTNPEHEVEIATAFGTTTAHPKQLRKLIKKKRDERIPKEVWIGIYPGGTMVVFTRKEDVSRFTPSNRIACPRYVIAKDQKK